MDSRRLNNVSVDVSGSSSASHGVSSSNNISKTSSYEDSGIIDENEKSGNPSTSYGVSPVIKEDDTIEIASMPKTSYTGNEIQNNLDDIEKSETPKASEEESLTEENSLTEDLIEKKYKTQENDNEKLNVDTQGNEPKINLEDELNAEVNGQNLEKSSKTDDTPELYLDANVQGNTKELDSNDELNAEANGQNDQNIDEDSEEKEKQTQEQNKDKKKEITVPWGLGATLGLEAIAPALLGGVLGPAAILMAILWLSHKSFKLPVTERAKQFKDKYHKKRETNKTNKTDNEQHIEKEDEVDMGTMSAEEQKEFMEIIEENQEAFNKTLVDLFIENKETFEKAFEDMKEIEGIEEIPNYNELVETINDLDKIINNSSISKEEKEEKIQEFIDIGDIFFEHLEKNEEIMNKLNEKSNVEKESIKTNSLFSAFKIIKDAKKVDNDVRKHGINASISQNGQGMSISNK